MFKLTCFFLFLGFSSALFAVDKKWNVITVVTDDQSAWSVGCYGQKDITTPHMDSLARDGALFSKAFVNSPVCSPSRATFLTGRHSTELGITDWITGGQAKKHGLTAKFPSWPEQLRKDGYQTGLIGKWHLGSFQAALPMSNGFTYFYGNPAGGWQPRKVVFTNNNGKTEPIEGDSVNICTDLAIDFIKENKDNPFALLVHYREPHAPYGPMPEIDQQATKSLVPTIPTYPKLRKNTRHLMKQYLTAVKAVDRNLGRILSTVKEQGLEDRTIIIFTSDHGYNIGHHGLRYKGNGYWLTEDKKGCRPNMFETSIGVPLLIKWPGVTKPGTKINAMTANIDLFSSVLNMLEIEHKKNPESFDFTPFLKGKKPTKWRDSIFGQYHMVNDSKHSMRMMRTTDWKLILHYRAKGKHELYDLKNDPDETTNLYDHKQHAAIQLELTKKLLKKMNDIGDHSPAIPSPQSK